jgi:hypothetical protein
MAGAVLMAGTVLGVLTPATGSTAAWADGPRYIKSTFTFENTIPAGELCDFNYQNVGTGSDNTAVFPDKTTDHFELNITHTNLETGFTLTEIDHFTFQSTAADGQTKEVGLFFHLRNADGRLVVVEAGQLVVVTATGEVLKFTPNINPDPGAVICPALGGHPAS